MPYGQLTSLCDSEIIRLADHLQAGLADRHGATSGLNVMCAATQHAQTHAWFDFEFGFQLGSEELP